MLKFRIIYIEHLANRGWFQKGTSGLFCLKRVLVRSGAIIQLSKTIGSSLGKVVDTLDTFLSRCRWKTISFRNLVSKLNEGLFLNRFSILQSRWEFWFLLIKEAIWVFCDETKSRGWSLNELTPLLQQRALSSRKDRLFQGHPQLCRRRCGLSALATRLPHRKFWTDRKRSGIGSCASREAVQITGRPPVNGKPLRTVGPKRFTRP